MQIVQLPIEMFKNIYTFAPKGLQYLTTYLSTEHRYI